MSKLNRRSLVASAAALPALAIPAASLPAHIDAISIPDPTFAAIDTHRTALLSAMRADKIICETPDNERTKEGDLACDHADAAEDDATLKLSEIVPTTFAGIFALMEYVYELHVGKVALPEEPNQWFVAWREESRLESSAYKFEDGELVDPFNGEPLNLPLMFWVMWNVQSALRILVPQGRAA